MPARTGYMKPGTGERPCITCGKPFRSQGPHNRMCNPCRSSADCGSDMSFTSFGSQRPSRIGGERNAYGGHRD